MVVCVIAVTLARTYNDDPALFNLLLLVSSIVCTVSFFTWFRYFSAYDLGTRRNLSRVVFGLALIGVIAAAIFARVSQRRVRFSGGMVPQWVAPSALDANLGQGQADLATTTPIDFPQFLGPHRNSMINGAEVS